MSRRAGPLADLRVLEFAGIGPGPFCAMLLADLGAEVVTIEKPGGEANGLPLPRANDVPARGRRSLVLDLKAPGAASVVLDLVVQCDALIEGFRPGVMEKLGIGPEPCLARNPRLVYGRMTGYGQTGPLAQTAGHDLNYIAIAGALAGMGRAGTPPVPPLNLVGDYGGGALYLAFGLLAGVLAARRTGQGDVIDAAMVDGVASLQAIFCGLEGAGQWRPAREANLLDGGAPFYDTYETADGRYVAVAALEPKFFSELARRLDLPAEDVARQYERAHWPTLRARLACLFATRSRDEWAAFFEGSDGCVTPVLSRDEAALHPHLAFRRTFEQSKAGLAPAAAPRFSRHVPEPSAAPGAPGAQTAEILADLGYSERKVIELREAGVIG